MSRSESAIAETRTKYEKYLRTIAFNILANNEDTDECVNDTYFRAWGSIPPNKPERLSAYLGSIVRNLALTVFRRQNAASRAGSQYALSLDELEDCVSGNDSPESAAESGLISQAISSYLRTLPEEARVIFVCRYFYNDSISRIAGYFGAGESKIKSSLYRTRNGLKEYLGKEGIEI
jgi:RNA polymerase sigma-70 factor (ECF subfamily)